MLLASAVAGKAQHPSPSHSYLGFDRNEYPGDAALPALHKSFHYTSYWLNNPPGAQQNSWASARC
jgi:hypothetical protein